MFLDNLYVAINTILSGQKIKYNIDIYTDGNRLLEDNKSKFFHVLFLDIEMPIISGIEVANELRKINSHIAIVFITNRDDLVFQSIQYKPFRFIRKSLFLEELPETVYALIHHFYNENEYYTFETKTSLTKIKVVNIIYIESRKHFLYVYCRDSEQCVRGTMNLFEEIFEPKGFIRIHSGYLVNFKYIYSINKTEVLLDNQERLPISRHRLAEVKKKLLLFTRGMG